MAISGHASYIPTMQEFLKHWEDANALLPPASPLMVDSQFVRDDLDDLTTLLLSQAETVQNLLTDQAVARGDVALAKKAALDHINGFNDKVRSDMGRSAYARALALVPSISDSEDTFIRTLQVVARLWSKINANPPPNFTAPLLLQDGMTLAAFNASIVALKGLYLAPRDMDVDLRVARDNRNDTEKEAYEMMRLYRLAVPTRFAADSPIVASLPILNVEAGRTPEAPLASAEWDGAAAKGKISFTPITDPDVKRYQLRWSPGDTYSVEDESVLDSLDVGAGTSFLTLQGLAGSGDTSLFRVVVELKTGHENGSEPVSVTRP